MLPLNQEVCVTPVVVGQTHAGALRTDNEDSIDWWIERNNGITISVLADGMGGHKGGALASKLAVSSIREQINHDANQHIASIGELENLLINAAQTANSKIQALREQEQELNEMGTTLVLAAMWRGHLSVLHAGDSRCYAVTQADKNASPKQLTRDDSVVQSMLEEGVITPEDVPNIPYRNRLTNALGIHATLRYCITSRSLNIGELMVICSDGFYQAVTMDQVRDDVASLGVNQQAAEHLIQTSVDNKTDDNTSVILMGYGFEPSPLTTK